MSRVGCDGSLRRWHLASAGQALLVVALLQFLSPAARAQSDTEKRTLANLALQWAVDGGIADVKLLKDGNKLVVCSLNLPADTKFTIPGREVSVLSMLRIQARADIQGDLLYFRIGPFSRKGDRVRVPVALEWALSVKRSGPPYLSGGGAALDFERVDGAWRLLPVQERWSS